MADEEQAEDSGALTPAKIVSKQKELNTSLGIVSRSATRQRVAADLAEYHKSRGWSDPTDERIDELVGEILS